RKPSTFEPPGGRDSTIFEPTLKTVVETLPPNSLSAAHFRPQRTFASGKAVEASTRSARGKPLGGLIEARTAML
ncbi:MAG: hypothetical protein WAQ73_02730, partial [Bacillota bacterium]